MKFKVLRKSFIHNTLYEEGDIVELEDKELARTKDGEINYEKHRFLEPLEKPEPKKKVEPAQIQDDAKTGKPAKEPAQTKTNTQTIGELTADQKNEILDALEVLDHSNDDLWTQSGLPKVEVISEIVGFDVQRKHINAVADKFTRSQSE